jgi:hypothetical protein
MKILSKKNTDYQEIPISISSPEFSYILHSAGRHQILRIFTDIVFETLFNFMFSSKLVNI